MKIKYVCQVCEGQPKQSFTTVEPQEQELALALKYTEIILV